MNFLNKYIGIGLIGISLTGCIMTGPYIYGVPRDQWYQMDYYQQQEVIRVYNYNRAHGTTVWVDDSGYAAPAYSTTNVNYNYYPAPRNRTTNIIVTDRDRRHHNHHHGHAYPRNDWRNIDRYRHGKPPVQIPHHHYRQPHGTQGGIGYQVPPAQGYQPPTHVRPSGEATVIRHNHHMQPSTQAGIGYQAPQASPHISSPPRDIPAAVAAAKEKQEEKAGAKKRGEEIRERMQEIREKMGR